MEVMSEGETRTCPLCGFRSGSTKSCKPRTGAQLLKALPSTDPNAICPKIPPRSVASRLIEVRRRGITVWIAITQVLWVRVNVIFVAREYCHDRSIAGQPPATVRTFGQHRLELADLAVRRIDNHGERVIASPFR